MITKNDYGMKLFNGNVGLILPDPERNGELGAFFRDTAGGLRRFAPVRLPAHETVYALTIHKSHGPEFDHILMILPDRDAPVLTRELIYTAITRARKSVTLWGEEELFIREDNVNRFIYLLIVEASPRCKVRQNSRLTSRPDFIHNHAQSFQSSQLWPIKDQVPS